jgi:hypothetical protein
MSKQELLAEIQKLPVEEQRQILDALGHWVAQHPSKSPAPISEAEFEWLLLAKGIISEIPDPAVGQVEEEFEPIVVRGKPLSETITEERQ